MKKMILAGLACCAVIGLSGCSSTKPMSLDAMNGKWNIVAVNGTPVIPSSAESAPYLAFNVKTGSVSGSTGCNNIIGSIMPDQPAGAMDFSKVATTMMACHDQGLEQSIVTALQNVLGYRSGGPNEVYLTNGGSQKLLTLRRAVQDYSINTLEGKWTILEVDGREVKSTADAPLTITFDLQGNFSCQTGCNNMMGDFTTGYTDITFGKVASTRMACPDMSVEQALGRVLPKIVVYNKLADGSLGFYNKDNDLLLRIKR